MFLDEYKNIQLQFGSIRRTRRKKNDQTERDETSNYNAKSH